MSKIVLYVVSGQLASFDKGPAVKLFSDQPPSAN